MIHRLLSFSSSSSSQSYLPPSGATQYYVYSIGKYMSDNAHAAAGCLHKRGVTESASPA